MKIIYDESNAIREKQEIDAETPAKNHQAKLQNTLMAIGYLLGVALAAFGLYWLCEQLKSITSDSGMHGMLNFLCVGLMIVVVLVTALLFNENHDEVLTAKQRYPASVIYHIATENKSILKSTIQKTDSCEILGDDYIVNLTLEDESHVVSEESVRLSCFHTQTRTDLDEITVDLDKRIVQVPYKS